MDRCRASIHYRSLLAACLLVTLLGFVFVGYLCPDRVCALNGLSYSQERYHGWSKLSMKQMDNMGRPMPFLSSGLQQSPPLQGKLSFDELVLSGRDFKFDIKGADVMVFLHIQKTGGTAFGRHLVRDLDLEQPCKCKRGRKKCRCERPDSQGRLWLFSRYSTGWRCGLHADWTELTNCVDSALDEQERAQAKRRYFYITLLREPVARFLSEFRHVQRGATWKTARHWCGGRVATPQELPPCFKGDDWTDVTLEEFMNCPSNLALNRQTRMLADLTLVNCYNRSAMTPHDRDVLLLASAKENLRKMAYFGLCEQQRISQYLFESTFRLNFLQPFGQLNETHSSLALTEIASDQVERIRTLNHLDIQLYSYAKELLLQRFQRLRERDPHFEEDFANLGRKKVGKVVVSGSPLLESLFQGEIT